MATEEKEAVEKPESPAPDGMFIIGYAVRGKYARSRIYRRHYDAVNASEGGSRNHYLTGGTVFPVYAMKENQ